MRINVLFSFEKLELPVNYNHIMQSFILQLIDDAEYRKFLHDEGYKHSTRSYKLFTFSELVGDFVLDRQRKIITFRENAVLSISSCNENLVRYCADSLLFKDSFQLLSQTMYVQKIDYESEKIESNEITVKTLSPITVYSTIDDGFKKKTVYFSPRDSQFSALVGENLMHKYFAIHSNDESLCLNWEIKIFPKEEKSLKKVVTRYKNFIIEAWNGVFVIQGDPILLQIGYDAGFGSKNSQGFGLVKTL